jgi:hypothetical protein
MIQTLTTIETFDSITLVDVLYCHCCFSFDIVYMSINSILSHFLITHVELSIVHTPTLHATILTIVYYFIFVYRFTETDDYRWFSKTIERVAEEELGSKYQIMVKKDDYFVDFLRYRTEFIDY